MSESTKELAKAETTEIEHTEAPSASIIQVIERAALNPAVDIDKMERLLQMQERIFARDAEMAFNSAMAAAQGEMEPVVRDARNQQTSSNYATLEAISKAVKPVTAKHGFALSFGTAESPLESHYRVTCDLTHIAGHSKHYHADIPADLTGMKGTANKTKTHAFGSTMSYGQRYLTKLIFDLATEDDDGNAAASGPRITEEQVLQLRELAEEVGADIAKFCAYGKIGSLEEISADHFKDAVARLEAKRNK